MILRSHAFLAFLVNSLKIASFTLQTQKDDLHKVSNDPTSHNKQSMGNQHQHQHGHGSSVVVGTFKKTVSAVLGSFGIAMLEVVVKQ
ncbi:hypothetical protein Lser_V15G05513 [Lactuca serriola]